MYIDWDPQGHRLVSTHPRPELSPARSFCCRCLVLARAARVRASRVGAWKPRVLAAALLPPPRGARCSGCSSGRRHRRGARGRRDARCSRSRWACCAGRAAAPADLGFAPGTTSSRSTRSALSGWCRGSARSTCSPTTRSSASASTRTASCSAPTATRPAAGLLVSLDGGLLFIAVMTGAVGLAGVPRDARRSSWRRCARVWARGGAPPDARGIAIGRRRRRRSRSSCTALREQPAAAAAARAALDPVGAAGRRDARRRVPGSAARRGPAVGPDDGRGVMASPVAAPTAPPRTRPDQQPVHARRRATGERVLLVKLHALGDVVLASAAASALKRRDPASHLTWMCSAGLADLVRLFPDVDEVVPVDSGALLRGGPLARARALARAWRSIAGRRFERALVAHHDARYGAVAWPARGARSSMRDRAAGRTLGVPGRWFGDEYARLALGIPDVGPIERAWDLAEVRGRLPDGRALLPGDDARPIAALVPGGARNALRDTPQRRWPVERYGGAGGASPRRRSQRRAGRRRSRPRRPAGLRRCADRRPAAAP